MAFAQSLDLCHGQRCAPGKPFRDRGLELMKVCAAMNACGLMGLDRSENIPGIRPPVGFEGLQSGPRPAQFLLPATVHLQHAWCTVVHERLAHHGDHYRLRGRDRCEAEQRGSERGPVSQVAKKPSHGVERDSEVNATLPYLAAAKA